MAQCSGTCQFEFRSDKTPSVTSYSISGSVLTLTGTLLDSDLTLLIGTHSFSVNSNTSATSAQFDILANLKAANYAIQLHVAGKGYATSSSIIVQLSFGLASITPNTGSYLGNQFELRGIGFDQSKLTKIFLQKDSNTFECTITSFTASLVKCFVKSTLLKSTTYSIKYTLDDTDTDSTHTYGTNDAVPKLLTRNSNTHQAANQVTIVFTMENFAGVSSVDIVLKSRDISGLEALGSSTISTDI